jgi:hypothetical protein
MVDDSFKEEYIRAKAEQRMLPMRRLRLRQFWLVAFALVFIILTFLLNAVRGSDLYNLVVPLFWLCFALGMIAIIRFILDFRRENVLQEEMKREAELERLQLLHDLAKVGQELRVNEKRKNSVLLSDDGEPASKQAQQKMTSRKR